MKYLIAELDSSKNLNYYEFNAENELNQYIETALGDIHSPVIEVRLYRLEKIGSRVSSIQWTAEKKTKIKSTGYDMNVIANPPKSRGKRTAWTENEVTYMQEALKMGMSQKGIAHKLNRTTHAIQVKMSRIKCN